jgi:hypothetical protein
MSAGLVFARLPFLIKSVGQVCWPSLIKICKAVYLRQ